MLNKLLSKRITGDFVVIDPVFPQKEPFAFRNTEINEYLARINNMAAYSMYPMRPGPEAWFEHGYGVTREAFTENKQGYLRHYPQNESKIHYLEQDRRYKFQLSYSYFLAETYTLLPFYEKNKIPFVFVLYPGGSFGINNSASDQMLQRVFRSPLFRKVIVTQQLTRDYLIEKHFCPEEKIEYIYGGFVQFMRDDVRPKQYFNKNKSTFDICFVAAKYSEGGTDKGYDIFIAAAKELCKTTDNIFFHVVGGFDEHDIDVSSIASRVKFYGYRRPDFLSKFYADMDIFLSPNRPGELYEGNFDGFPLGIDAGYCGVALLVADELKMNQNYRPDNEICIIPLHTGHITAKILYYYNNPDKLYALSAAGQRRIQALFDINFQISARVKVFDEFVALEPHQ